MSRDKNSPQDDENRQEPEDVIRFPARPRSQPPRQRPSRDDILRRLRRPPSSRERERDSGYPQTDPTTTRPRQTRDFREEEEQERAQRQTPPAREPHTTRPMRDDAYRDREPRQQRPRERDYRDERYMPTQRRREIDTEAGRYDDYEAYRRRVRRSGTRSLPPYAPPPKRRARRSIWSTLLIGFIGGIIMIGLVVGIGWFFLIHTLQVSFPGLGIGTSKFTAPQQTVPLNITANTTQLQVVNNLGSITISDDNTLTTGGTLTYVKKTQASSSSAATSNFNRIQVNAQPGNSAACPQASCVLVTASVPPNIAGTVDMTLVLPAQSPTPQFVLNGKTQTGNIVVQNFSGLLTLTDDTGNIDVKGGLLDAGSCLQARIGNVTFAGTLETGTAPAINPCQGNPITSPNSTQPWYSMKVGTGNIDVTLNAVSANIVLDATVLDSGKLISNDYPLSVPPSNTPGYNGPLLPGSHPTAQLFLAVDNGNITLHKG
ncbi:MAG: hypothetical protein ACRDIV_23490, partial [Ktedonobacteraceae bacterium]